MHITVTDDDNKLREVAVAWAQAKGHYFGSAKEDIPAGAKITVFIDKPKEPEKPKRGVSQAKTAES